MKSPARLWWSLITLRSESVEWCWHRSSLKSGSSNSSFVVRDVSLTSMIHHGGTSPLNHIWMKRHSPRQPLEKQRGGRGAAWVKEGWGRVRRATEGFTGLSGEPGGLSGDYRGNDRLALLVFVTQTSIWILLHNGIFGRSGLEMQHRCWASSCCRPLLNICHLLCFFFIFHLIPRERLEHQRDPCWQMRCLQWETVFILQSIKMDSNYNLSINCSLCSRYIRIRNTRVLISKRVHFKSSGTRTWEQAWGLGGLTGHWVFAQTSPSMKISPHPSASTAEDRYIYK